MITQEQFEQKWYGKIVKPKKCLNYIPNKEYFVTTCLLGCYQNNKLTKFCIMATDYNKENKHYISFDLLDEEAEKLEDKFEILGDYDNIQSEVLIEIKGFWEAKDGKFNNFKAGKYCIIDSYCFGTKVVLINEKYLIPCCDLRIVDKLYDIQWLSTTGERLVQIFLLEKEEWDNKTREDIYKSFGRKRSFIKTGLYHFSSIPNI